MTSTPPVITRFAPSPTGHLHIGGARSALFCWAFAKRNGGHFTLRIEDTDQARSSEESARGIMEDLAWLGIEWDEGPTLTLANGRKIGGDPRGVGPFFQAQRMATYNAYLMNLIERGKAYPAFEKSDELEAKRKAAVAAKQTYRYDRAALREMPEINDRLKRMETGEPHVVRFFAPHEEVIVHDEVLGDVRYAAGEMDDFVIRKADGFPTYHFAVVIDDELMGVTHVMRAQEHLNNTPRHVALQRALVRLDTGAPFRTPIYGHMPLIFNMDATKMSKRDKAKAARAELQKRVQAGQTAAALAAQLHHDVKEVEAFLAKDNDSLEIAGKIATTFAVALPEIEVSDFRENGYAPEAIDNFLALLGWNPGLKTADGKDLEKFDNTFLAQNFSIERIGKTNAKFDRKKLLSFNGDCLTGMSDEQFLSRWKRWFLEEKAEPRGTPRVLADVLADPKRGLWLATAVKLRAKTFGDALSASSFLWKSLATAADFDAGAVEKNLKANSGAGFELLREFRSAIAGLGEFTPASIHGAMETLAKAKGFLNEKGVNVGPVAQPVRVAIAGVAVTPPLGETLAVLGKDQALGRIDTCLKLFA